MRCPRCTLTELSEAAETCSLCGYSSAATVAVDEAPPNELDARRELARECRREFRIEALLQRPPGPIVYLARDAEERPLALKVAPRVDGGPEDRFHAAADAAAELAHPHIVPVYRHGATENFLWCAATYVDARSLATMLQTSGPLELSACVRIFEQVASALDYAHRRGVAHGALTPGSIMVDANEWVLVDDFATRGLLDSAPEGAAGEPAAKAGEDQRALAAIAYECLTGTPLGDSLPAGEDGLPGLPLHVAQALRRAVSSGQADRFPSVLDFVAAPPAPATGAPPMAPSASSDTFLPPARDAAPRSSATPAPVRPKRPSGTTRAPVVRRPARHLEPGFLSVNAIPWGSVYLDGRPVGNTPQIDLQVAAGPHRLRVEREGYRPYDRVIDVASGQRLRITDIALAER